MKIKKYLLVLGLITSLVTTKAQSLEQGYEAFLSNDHKKAMEHFKEAKQNPNEKEEALLMLALLESYGRNPDQLFTHMTELVKTSSEVEPFLSILWSESFGGYEKVTPAQMTLLNNIIKDPKYSGYLKTKAYYSLGEHFKELNDLKKVKTNFDKMGTLTNFSMVGPFENISASGFNKDFGPVTKSEPTDEFINKNHAPVKWFEMTTESGNWIDFGSHFINGNAIFYAQTFCNSPTEQEVNISLGYSGSIKLWLNGTLLFSDEEERSMGIDNYICPVKLSAGENRILIQLGDSDDDEANYMMRIVDNNGTPIKGLTYTAFSKGGNYPKKAASIGKASKNKDAEFLENKSKNNMKSYVYRMLLAKSYLMHSFRDEARFVLEKLREEKPDCSYFLNQMMLVHIQDKNRTALSEAIEIMRKMEPGNMISLNMDYDEAKTAENWEKCNDIVKKMKDAIGEKATVLEKMIEMAAIEKKFDELVQLNKTALKMYPDNFDFVELQYTIEKELNKNPSAALKVLTTFNKKNYNVRALEMQAQAYFTLGSAGFSKGMAILKDLASNYPNRASSYTTLAGVYLAIKDYKSAIDAYKEALRIAPYVGKYNSNLALAYEESGDKTEALKYYQNAIVYYAKDYETMARIRNLEGKKEIWSLFGETDLYSLFERKIEKSEYPEDNSVILWYEGQRVIYPGGGSETKFHIAIKMLNVEGVDYWKEYYVPSGGSESATVEKAEIIKANGNKIQAEVNYNSIVFTGLEPGDGILIVYKVQNYYSGKLSEHFWDKHYLSSFTPMEKSKYQLLVPSNKTFDYKVSNSDIVPTIGKQEDFSHFVWESENVAAYKDESYMPTISDMGKVLFISSFPSWDFISKWYWDLAITKSKSTEETRRKAKELLKGHENDSDLEKAKIIYAYVVKDIRYSSISFRQSGLIPQRADDVINTKIGDCKDVSTLFVALCKEAGLDAQLVLVNTRDNGANDMMLPSIEFNHCIAKLIVGNEEHYIELTSDNYSFGTMDEGLKGAFYLDVTGSSTVEVSPGYLDPKIRPSNQVIRNTKISFDDNKMAVSKVTHKTGSYAASMRDTYRHMGKDEQFKEMNQAVSGEYPSLKFKELTFNKNLDSGSDTVTYSYAYDANNVFTKIGDLNIMKIPLTDGFAPFQVFSTEERLYDIELWKMISSERSYEEVTIEMPKGKKIAEVPKSVNYTSEFATYSLTFTKNANGSLTIKREFKLIEEMIPKEKYAAAQKFFEDIVTADTQQIGFKSVTP